MRTCDQLADFSRRERSPPRNGRQCCIYRRFSDWSMLTLSAAVCKRLAPATSLLHFRAMADAKGRNQMQVEDSDTVDGFWLEVCQTVCSKILAKGRSVTKDASCIKCGCSARATSLPWKYCNCTTTTFRTSATRWRF